MQEKTEKEIDIEPSNKRGPREIKLTRSTSEAFPYGCNNANDIKALVQHALQWQEALYKTKLNTNNGQQRTSINIETKANNYFKNNIYTVCSNKFSIKMENLKN